LDTTTGQELWSFSGTSDYLGQPVISPDGDLYVDDGDTLRALEPRTGAELWAFSVAGATLYWPSVGLDGTVFVISQTGLIDDNVLHALDPETGEERWTFVEWGLAEEPAFRSDGTLCVTGSASVYALDGSSGSVLWTFFDSANQGVYSPLIGTYGNLIVTMDTDSSTGPDTVGSLSLTDGTEQWRFDTQRGIVKPILVAPSGVIYITGERGLETNAVLYALNSLDGSVLWSFSPPGSLAPSTLGASVLKDGVVYVTADDVGEGYLSVGIGSLFALDASDGTVLWSFPTGTAPGEPLSQNQRVFFPANDETDDEGTLHALETSSGTESWTFVTPNENGLSDLRASTEDGVFYLSTVSWVGDLYALSCD